MAPSAPEQPDDVPAEPAAGEPVPDDRNQVGPTPVDLTTADPLTTDPEDVDAGPKGLAPGYEAPGDALHPGAG